jgi:cyclase
MALNRVIARLDIKQNRLIKGMHLEGWRFLPKPPSDYCLSYYEQGIDEILYIDVVASLYGRDALVELIKNTTKNVFVPITAGGGVKTVDDATALLRAGADKVAVCSGAIKNPSLIAEIADKFGSQCMVISIQAQWNKSTNQYDAYYDIGRENSGKNVIDWAKEAVNLGAGEILLTCINTEGTRKGYDLELIEKVSKMVNVPVIASGGAGKVDDIEEAMRAGANATAIAYGLHFNTLSIAQIKSHLINKGISVRPI